jgi:hypothetical protein
MFAGLSVTLGTDENTMFWLAVPTPGASDVFAAEIAVDPT